jgi:hypothetical protein
VNVGVDDVRERVGVIAPDLVDDLRAAERLPGWRIRYSSSANSFGVSSMIRSSRRASCRRRSSSRLATCSTAPVSIAWVRRRRSGP